MFLDCFLLCCVECESVAVRVVKQVVCSETGAIRPEEKVTRAPLLSSFTHFWFKHGWQNRSMEPDICLHNPSFIVNTTGGVPVYMSRKDGCDCGVYVRLLHLSVAEEELLD